jgi:hypothetical protein
MYIFYAKIDFLGIIHLPNRVCTFLQTRLFFIIKAISKFLRYHFYNNTRNTDTNIILTVFSFNKKQNKRSFSFGHSKCYLPKKATEAPAYQADVPKTCCSTNHGICSYFFNSSDRNCETGIPL